MQLQPLIKSKKGVLGLDTVKAVMIALLTLGVITVAVVLALVTLRDAGIFSAGSLEKNQTTDVINNITKGATSFFSNVPTFFVLLGVVVLILIISIVIISVSRFSGGRGESL